MSLLTGAPMTAAEVARELGMTHANASYHMRQLAAAGQIALAGEERIHGGVARRYRYVLDDERSDQPMPDQPERHALHRAVAAEMVRRSAHRLESPRRSCLADADLWVRPEAWDEVRGQIMAASRTLHEVAQPPRTAGTIRVSASIALFEMDPDA